MTIEYLSLWRTTTPLVLHRHNHLSDDLIAFLTQRTVARTTCERNLLDEILRSAVGRADPLLAFAAYIQQRGNTNDLSMSWVLAAALLKSRLAPLVLAQVLAERARAIIGQSVDPSTHRQASHRSSPIERREARRTIRLAHAWSEEITISFLSQPALWQEAFGHLRQAVVGSAIATEKTRRPHNSANAASSPSLIVVSEIGEPDCEGGAEMVASYGSLTSPLPLKSGRIAADLIEAALSAEFPNMGDVIHRISGDLRLRARSGIPWDRFRPLLLVGPPGTGKTRFAKRLARPLDIGYGEVSAAGSSDNRALQGTARGFRYGQPCLPLLTMKQSQCANPLILVDEIDKAGGSDRAGDIRQTLLTMLEPQSARTFFDEALLATADLSQISWILTANSLSEMSAPLLSRVGIVDVPLPGPQDLDNLLDGILNDIAKELSVTAMDLPPLDPLAIAALRRRFAGGIDIRRLRRAIDAVLRGPTEAARLLH
jgi:hypothetical protein